jgi:hypothetical protein
MSPVVLDSTGTSTGASRAQARMEQAMADSGTAVHITRAGSGTPTLDEATGNLVQPTPIDVYAGKALVNVATTRGERTTIRGSEQETLTEWQVSIPLSAGPVKIGDEVQVTANSADPQLVRTRMWVVRLPSGSHVARRRLLCSATQTGPRT